LDGKSKIMPHATINTNTTGGATTGGTTTGGSATGGTTNGGSATGGAGTGGKATASGTATSSTTTNSGTSTNTPGKGGAEPPRGKEDAPGQVKRDKDDRNDAHRKDREKK
jgi:hypothetical protein